MIVTEGQVGWNEVRNLRAVSLLSVHRGFIISPTPLRTDKAIRLNCAFLRIRSLRLAFLSREFINFKMFILVTPFLEAGDRLYTLPM